MTGSDLAQQFANALSAVQGAPEILDSAEQAFARARELAADRTILIDDHPDLGTLPAEFSDRIASDPWHAQAGITGVTAAAADTGTLVLAASPSTPRSTSLLPPMHVAIVPFSRLAPTYADAFEVIAALDPQPSSIHLISGPSRSADIEFKLVRGVHGPADVHVLLHP